MKSHHSRSLGNETFDEYRHFFSKNHRHRTPEKYLFNGKEEIALKPQRMTPRLWKLEYNRICQGINIELSMHQMLNDCNFFFYYIFLTLIDNY